MGSVVGTATVKIVPELSEVFRVVIAAVKLNDALVYGGADVLAGLPPAAKRALAELQRALNHRGD